MCWSPKVKTPKVTMPQTAPAAAPVQETPAAVQFGDDEDTQKEISKTGISSVKIDKQAEDQNNSESSTNFGSAVPKTGGAGVAKSFTSSALKKATASSIRK